MAGAADLAFLREALQFLPTHISGSNSHATLAGACEALGLPAILRADEGSKYERAPASFTAALDTALPAVAEAVLATCVLNASQRNNVQDALWATQHEPVIPKRTRREIARTLHLDDLVHDGERFTRLLETLWVLDDDPLGVIFGARSTLREHIAQHVYRNSDWSAEELFERLGASKPRIRGSPGSSKVLASTAIGTIPSRGQGRGQGSSRAGRSNSPWFVRERFAKSVPCSARPLDEPPVGGQPDWQAGQVCVVWSALSSVGSWFVLAALGGYAAFFLGLVAF